MNLSRERLLSEAAATGFRAEILEKAIRLLVLLEGLRSHPFLKGRFALKGGTALNLFVFDVPRLSVDLDINYIGAADREGMLAERPKIEVAIGAVCEREGFLIPVPHVRIVSGAPSNSRVSRYPPPSRRENCDRICDRSLLVVFLHPPGGLFEIALTHAIVPV